MRFALIGSPVAHSLSPLMHNAGYRALGIEATYEAVELSEIESEGPWSQFDGLSVTMPLKQKIIPFLDSLEPSAAATGVVNTVVNSAGLKVGFNTDIYGISQAIQHAARQYQLEPQFKKAVIIGGRASACSALAALGELGRPETFITARTLTGPGTVTAARRELRTDFLPVAWRLTDMIKRVLTEADLVISTVPAKVLEGWDESFQLKAEALVLEASYANAGTWLQAACQRSDAHYIPGVEMLFHQAIQQFALHTGKAAPVEAMREALDQHLAQA
ncbi:hypothetical protein BSR29_04520 [Boudabousia liubingyangii]|uniref:Shikimate dehydrogenase n=1 Tax=Boudabousia liubingyangii TaxID=1921764 RepID=A0A1Q5PNI7_9ACTO|nr:hypothetical protein [Boudabousia liubingyangii]OKL49102.1 hypothetical protein BSR29_04520 [Boudabousia liubingyangii]